ncbi:hypothetical protein [Halobacillus seohaensis]|uniref:Uncharacterized protein n=1 Tax=Halobacillus seohaensis TaxID=447421 RepID=A0ABW2ENF2_9BACI
MATTQSFFLPLINSLRDLLKSVAKVFPAWYSIICRIKRAAQGNTATEKHHEKVVDLKLTTWYIYLVAVLKRQTN